MISTSNISVSFGGRKLFDDVNIKFLPGNCYGLIGANGAGKSTFLKVLSGELESQTGHVNLNPGERISVLKQDQFAYDQEVVIQVVLQGNPELMAIMEEKNNLYLKDPFTEEDGIRASELEGKFAELNGWEAESEAGSLLEGLGISTDLHQKPMSELNAGQKVKVLLAQALFGNPDILLLDEPTNNLDIKAIQWLENFIANFKNTVIVVSHDRHFLNQVCTHIADIDFGKISIYAGNYDFWRQSSELAQRLRSDLKKKNEDKAQELKNFIQRFSANASKSKQATSRQKMLEKLELGDMPISTRKYPYVHFEQKREAGKEILTVKNLSYESHIDLIDNKKVNTTKVKLLNNVSFVLNKGDKIAILNDSDVSTTSLFEILAKKISNYSGDFFWGVTTTYGYFPVDNSSYFDDGKYDLVNWLRQYSEDQTETFVRGFLGKMLFSGQEALKKTNVLSGGEKVRCMLSKLMLSGANVLLLDGPTAHLDLESITAVNEGLIRYKGTILFSSHDHEFIQTVANRILHFEKGKLVADEYTTYDDYMVKLIK
jgi:ATPase subunit of ABC transporter with duplicated ATPase domains